METQILIDSKVLMKKLYELEDQYDYDIPASSLAHEFRGSDTIHFDREAMEKMRFITKIIRQQPLTITFDGHVTIHEIIL